MGTNMSLKQCPLVAVAHCDPGVKMLACLWKESWPLRSHSLESSHWLLGAVPLWQACRCPPRPRYSCPRTAKVPSRSLCPPSTTNSRWTRPWFARTGPRLRTHSAAKQSLHSAPSVCVGYSCFKQCVCVLTLGTAVAAGPMSSPSIKMCMVSSLHLFTPTRFPTWWDVGGEPKPHAVWAVSGHTCNTEKEQQPEFHNQLTARDIKSGLLFEEKNWGPETLVGNFVHKNFFDVYFWVKNEKAFK